MIVSVIFTTIVQIQFYEYYKPSSSLCQIVHLREFY